MLRISLSNNVYRKKMSLLRSLTKTSFATSMFFASYGLVLLTGCGIGAVDTSSSPVPVQGAVLHGHVHGGNQPVSGSLIQVWQAGTGGYGTGSASIMNAGTTVMTSNDGTGSFTITNDYTCPSSDTQVYITATGGNPGLTPPQGGTINNSALVLMVALGSCGQLQANAATTFIDINEVSTVAAAYSLAQFATPNAGGTGISVGTSAGNTTGLTNAMKTVNNLVDLGTGTALTITPSYKAQGGTTGGLLNSSYVPQARINTLADILANCVNTDGTSSSGAVNGSGNSSAACNSLFVATTAGGVTPTDTLQAILSIAQHPGNNAAGIFGLFASDGAPFQPVLSSPAPVDWTLALTYSGGGLGVPAGTDPGYAAGISQMAIDAQGNIWAVGGCYDENFNAYSEVIELDNQGNGISPSLTSSGALCSGGYQPQFGGSPLLEAVVGVDSVAMDLSGNIWLGGPSGISKLASDGSGQQANFPNPCTGSNGDPITRVAIDPSSGNFWAGCSNQNGSVSLVGISSIDGSLIGQGGAPGNDIGDIALDISGNVWAVAASGTSFGQPGGNNLIESSFSGGVNPNQDNFFNDNKTIGSIAFLGSVVPDGLGSVFSPSGTGGTVTKLEPDGATIDSLSYPVPNGAFGLQQLALDGSGIVWGVAYSGNAANYGNALIPSYLVAMDASGNILSPSGTSSQGASIYGYTGTGGGGETQNILANAAYNFAINLAETFTAGIAIDESGNVWVANSGIASPTFDAAPAVSPGEQIVEFIGMAAPVRTPMVQAVFNGEVGVRPQAVHAPAQPFHATSTHK
jgi:hypothetical protein